MTSEPLQQAPHDLCTHRAAEECAGCDVSGSLMCRFEPGDLAGFFLGFLPFGIAVVAGMIHGGYGWWLLGWLAIWFLFFFVLEGRVLCSHCPYWAKESRVLHCHANYGVIKLSKERLRPLHQLFLPVQRRSQAVGRRLSAAKPGHAEGVGSQRLSPGGVNGDLSPRGRVVLGLTAGSGLGTVAGLIGRGGGSVVVPLLYIAGLEARNAAATSAFVVTCSGTSSFISHLATAAQPQWGIWIATVLAVLLGSQFGSRLMAGRLKSRAVKQVFGWVLLGVAALIVVKDVILA